jgi:hypothetical protein
VGSLWDWRLESELEEVLRQNKDAERRKRALAKERRYRGVEEIRMYSILLM